jgi:hypothetical protein
MKRKPVLSVTCPSCGRPSAIAQWQKHGRQLARCRYCKEFFFLYLVNGNLTDVVLWNDQQPKSTH